MFARYVASRALREAKEMSYRVYVTDSLRCVPQMMYLPKRWADIVNRSNKDEPEKTSEEIVDGVIAKFRG